MEIPLHWRLKAQRYRLEGSTCPTCGRPTFPPRPVCPRCIDLAVRVTNSGLLVFSDIESRIPYRFIERKIR